METKSGIIQKIPKPETVKYREAAESTSAEAREQIEAPAEDPQAKIQQRLDEIQESLNKFDGQLFEFSEKLENPDFDPDTKEVIEKIMQKIAEQQTALVEERAKKEQMLNKTGQSAIDTQVIRLRRRQTKVDLPRFPAPEGDKLPQAVPPELPAEALTELPPELPADALQPIEEPVAKGSPDLYRALEGTPADKLVERPAKINPYGRPEEHILNARLEGDERRAKLAESIEKQKAAIAPIVKARRKANEKLNKAA